ncbi:MAG: hypothetical protein QM679_07815 [Patulibacter sp.]
MAFRSSLAAAVMAALLSASPAFAGSDVDAPKDTAKEIAAAVAVEPSAPAPAPISTLDVPADGADGVDTGAGVNLGLPAEGKPTVVGNTAIYESDDASNSSVAVQAVGGGVRALINIDSADAPERYDFPLSGDVVSLQAQPDGSVLTIGADGVPNGVIDAPWARDKAGRDVPTHYEINGTTLTQVIEHRAGSYTYGITADPSWVSDAKWLLSKCLGLTFGSDITLRALFPNIQSAAKFVIRRLGVWGALWCGGGIISAAL